MKYVLYLRVSTDKQEDDTQLDECLRYLKARNPDGFDYQVYSDEITSRCKLANRHGLQDALRSLTRGDVLVALRTDRLARNLGEVTRIVDYLDGIRAEIILVDQPGIKNKALLGLYAGMAEEEGKMIRKRVKERLRSKRERLERTSYSPMYGYRYDPDNLIEIKKRNEKKPEMKIGKLIEVESEQIILKKMIELFDQDLSFRRISEELANLGYMNRQGKRFQSTSLNRILQRTGRSRHWDPPQAETDVLTFLE